MNVGWDSAVGKATRYRVEGAGIESGGGGGEIFPTCPDRWIAARFRELRQPGFGIDHPPPSDTEVKEWVDLSFFPGSVPGRVL